MEVSRIRGGYRHSEFADFGAEGEAIHFGHLHVEDGEVEGFALIEEFEGLGHSSASRASMPHLRDWRVRMRRLVGLSSTMSRRKPVSLGWGPARTGGATSLTACCRVMVKWKVEPWPTMLSTHMRPFMSSARLLLMARPRPVPP
jgi:hypothetical protein